MSSSLYATTTLRHSETASHHITVSLPVLLSSERLALVRPPSHPEVRHRPFPQLPQHFLDRCPQDRHDRPHILRWRISRAVLAGNARSRDRKLPSKGPATFRTSSSSTSSALNSPSSSSAFCLWAVSARSVRRASSIPTGSGHRLRPAGSRSNPRSPRSPRTWQRSRDRPHPAHAGIRIWDLERRRELGKPLTGHTDTVAALAVAESQGRTAIVSGSTDQSIRI
jgi:hypothetical protein